MSTEDESSPPMKRRRLTEVCSSYGTPKEISDIQPLRFTIHDFANLPQTKHGQFLYAPPVKAFGMRWKLRLYPHGHVEGGKVHLAAFLYCRDAADGNDVKANCTMRCGTSTDIRKSKGCVFEGKKGGYGHGFPKLASREKILGRPLLSPDGSLTIYVDLQVFLSKKKVWYPTEPEGEAGFGKQLLESAVESDISFLLSGRGRGKGGNEGGDEEEDSPQQHCEAHRAILAVRAPCLYEFIKEGVPPGGEFKIPNITPSIFKRILHYIYTGYVPKLSKSQQECGDDAAAADDDDENEGNSTEDRNEAEDAKNGDTLDENTAKELLSAANRFGLVYLKLYLESELVAKVLTIDNTAEWLLFSDGNCCPLLKEESMILFKQNQSHVMASSGFRKVKESSDLLVELLQFVPPPSMDNNDNDLMSVRTLREKLERYNLDLDGTRDMLIKRLQQYDSTKQAATKEAK